MVLSANIYLYKYTKKRSFDCVFSNYKYNQIIVITIQIIFVTNNTSATIPLNSGRFCKEVNWLTKCSTLAPITMFMSTITIR
jgi:hypothetical protein